MVVIRQDDYRITGINVHLEFGVNSRKVAAVPNDACAFEYFIEEAVPYLFEPACALPVSAFPVITWSVYLALSNLRLRNALANLSKLSREAQ
jgi:hypothetical protein